MNPRVIGLDLSLTGSGIASSRGWCEVVGRADITTLPLAQRDAALVALAREITHLIGGVSDLIVIEAPAYSRSGGGAHERAGLWWRVVHILLGEGHTLVEVLPNLRSTYATGRHNAPKTHVVDAVARRWPTWQTGGDENAADAVVLMAMGLDHLGHPAAIVPARHHAALERVAWPEAVAA
ncbi:hypothetical protein [Spongiactinospora sp. TRM90649]|uniref:hypothetical protein n=1 Tax=Spongiactinospora sp. TRM90649 TaxID=3031114 RepID=UPI0023F6680C|nr:hypothetical protein [Spongiactinospora sp. TRM90649]MDF5755795.1 hypothetical protein [Spongiactinospora sp. TRM90649]